MTGEELKSLRRELRCTARELADTLGLEQETILAWEREETFPTKAVVLRLEELRTQGASAITRKPKTKPAALGPLELFADPGWLALLRKLMAHPELRARVTELAEAYEDPAKR